MSSKTYGVGTTTTYGTVGEQENDRSQIETIKKYAFKSYEDEIVVKLPYVEYFSGTLLGVGGMQTIQQFRVNSCYDFNLSVTGHSPLGFDTWASIYNYYRVLECKIKVEIMDVSVDADGGSSPSVYGGMLDITANPPSSYQSWLEAYCVSNANRQQVFTYPQWYNINVSHDKPVITFEMNWTPDLFEKGTLTGNNDTPWTAVGANPATAMQEYFTIIGYVSSSVNREYHCRVWAEQITAFKQVNRTLLNTTN